MQAIILAAGMGRRLGEYTQQNTKCMVEVNGVKMIDRLLNQLSKLQLNRIVIVVGYEGKKLVDYISSNYDTSKLNIQFINNKIYDKTNNIYSLYLAKKELQEDDTLLIESDLVFEDKLFDDIINNDYPNLALVAKYQPWMDGTMVRIDKDNNIVNFIPKKAFSYADIDRYYKTINIYKFSKAFSIDKYVPFLDAYCKALGNNEYYEQVLRVITFLDGTELRALPIDKEKWYEIDDVQDLDIAEALFSDSDEKLAKFQSRFGGYWRFPDMLDYCYLVNPYFPNQDLKEELKANFDELIAQYPSGMKINSLLAGKYFNINSDYVCVGNGAAELIKSLMENLDGNIGVVYPTFEEYPNRKKNMIVPFIPDNSDFSYSVDDLMEFFKDKQLETLLLINPDNPSGNFISIKEVYRLIAWAKLHSIKLIIDESFVDFTDGHEKNSLLHDELLELYTQLYVVKSISKSYGVPGLRLGVLASSNKEQMDAIKRDVSIWNINSFGEFYMQIFGKYEKQYYKACDKFIQERNRFYELLTDIAFLRVIPSQANYFLCEVTDRFSSKELAKILLDKYNILIKDCSSKKAFNNRNYIRLAVRSSEDNNRLIDALKNIEL